MWVLWMASRPEPGRWWGKNPQWSMPYRYQRLSSAHHFSGPREFVIVDCREDVMSWVLL